VTDLGIGAVLALTGAFAGAGTDVPVYVICLAAGVFYLGVGIVIALVKLRRQGK
jgi:hypothetical protein